MLPSTQQYVFGFSACPNLTGREYIIVPAIMTPKHHTLTVNGRFSALIHRLLL
nr:MAG TPA: hypothetical protein [Caudoviricetes sp.]